MIKVKLAIVIVLAIAFPQVGYSEENTVPSKSATDKQAM
jgi:hypothetical protein